MAEKPKRIGKIQQIMFFGLFSLTTPHLIRYNHGQTCDLYGFTVFGFFQHNLQEERQKSPRGKRKSF
jgi:hypothetical protein